MILCPTAAPTSSARRSASDTILVGTVDGVALLAKSERGWTVKHRALQGVFVSGVTALDDGTLFASTRGVGMARSDDGGFKWTWVNEGLAHHEFWSCRAGKLQGRDVVFAGALPAHLYVSEDKGKSWRELKAFRDAKTVKQWTFPPPPRIGHIKDIVLDGDRLWVGVEIGSLQVSKDFGAELHRAAGRSRSAGVRHPSHPGASGAARPHHHRQRHRRHDVERGRRQELAADEDADRGELSRTPSSSIPTSPTCCSCRPASAGRCTGMSLAARAARFSGAATPARPGSGCSAACRTASARCSPA